LAYVGVAPERFAALLVGIMLAVVGLLLVKSAFFDVPQAANGEILTVPFSRLEPTYTQHAYDGVVTLVISGTGQAGGTDWSDAFYLYMHSDGTLYDPPQLEHFDLEIDGERAIAALDRVENPPPFSRDHVYHVTYDVGSEARRIAFRISDSLVDDNKGEFRIEIRRE
jgi:hypothetical protein